MMVKVGRKLGSLVVLSVIALGLSAAQVAAAGPAGLARNADPDLSTSRIATSQATLAPFAHVRFCLQSPQECTVVDAPPLVTVDSAKMDDLKALNARINAAIIPANDTGPDVWSLWPPSGDCEDYAITKRAALIAAGWPAPALRLAVTRTLTGEGHAVLVVSTTDGDWVLDNRTDEIRDWREAGLQWLKIQSSEDPRVWLAVAKPVLAPLIM
ncbi:transglutaminase-like cysteine peptidase [Allorhizobium pseudoryzae]|uniref:transglutaminase-like cysteine peptidase n=1 Tax=Allorhizobium pseudoryzae TaxID=379684 RepID=UPI003CFC8EE9